MERLVRIAKKTEEEHNFNGYIHLKTIPGASDELIREAWSLKVQTIFNQF